MLVTILHQCLSNSEAVRELIEQEYRSVPRSEDRDRTVPLSVHPLAIIKKDRYWLVEGRDSNFRLFRETDPTKHVVNWESIADTIQGLRDFCDSIDHEGRPGRDLARKIRDNVIPRHEAAEHRRVRAKVAAERLAIFRAQPPVYSMRTRGRRYNYAQSDSDSDNRADKERKSRVLNGELQQTTTASGRTIRRPQRDDLGQAPELGTERVSAEQNTPVWRSDESSGENEDDQDTTESEISESEVSDNPRSLQLTLKYNLPIKAPELQTFSPLMSNEFNQKAAQLPQLNPMTYTPPTQPSTYPTSQAPLLSQHSYGPQSSALSYMALQNQHPSRPQNAQFIPYVQNSMNYQPKIISGSTHLQQYSVPPQSMPYTSVSSIPNGPPFQQRNTSGNIPMSYYNSSVSQLPMNYHLPQPRVAEGSVTLPNMAQPTELLQQPDVQSEDIQNKSDPKVGSVEHILNP